MIDDLFLPIRPRRNRKSSWVRELLAETSLDSSDLIMPFFVIDGNNKKEPITALPNQYRFSIDLLLVEIARAKKLGICAIMLFPAIDQNLKTKDAKEAYNSNNLICQAIKAIKAKVPEIAVICDVALDPYTTHGHDGLLLDMGDDVLNDATILILCKQALVQAQAGCDIIAPSDMMDYRVKAIRNCLDKNGFESVSIMSYCVKYASNFYGPFRSAVGSSQSVAIDKKTYQMDFRNSIEAQREIDLDVTEGADMLIVKPGLIYLDIVAKAKQSCNLPIISYQVSGEYAMLKIACDQGILDFMPCLYETFIAFKRAGATAIISYGAIEMADYLFNS
jgi:porphobilinogen synthase